jgi:transposase
VQNSDKKCATIQGYYCVCYNNASKSVFFVYNPSRCRDALKILLESYQRKLQTDGYGSYVEFYNVLGMTLLRYLAHAHRKFIEAKTSYAQLSQEALKWFSKVYDVEKYIREHKLTGEEKLAYQLENPIFALEAFHSSMLHKYAVIQLPGNSIRKTIEY